MNIVTTVLSWPYSFVVTRNSVKDICIVQLSNVTNHLTHKPGSTIKVDLKQPPMSILTPDEKELKYICLLLPCLIVNIRLLNHAWI